MDPMRLSLICLVVVVVACELDPTAPAFMPPSLQQAKMGTPDTRCHQALEPVFASACDDLLASCLDEHCLDALDALETSGDERELESLCRRALGSDDHDADPPCIVDACRRLVARDPGWAYELAHAVHEGQQRLGDGNLWRSTAAYGEVVADDERLAAVLGEGIGRDCVEVTELTFALVDVTQLRRQPIVTDRSMSALTDLLLRDDIAPERCSATPAWLLLLGERLDPSSNSQLAAVLVCDASRPDGVRHHARDQLEQYYARGIQIPAEARSLLAETCSELPAGSGPPVFCPGADVPRHLDLIARPSQDTWLAPGGDAPSVEPRRRDLVALGQEPRLPRVGVSLRDLADPTRGCEDEWERHQLGGRCLGDLADCERRQCSAFVYGLVDQDPDALAAACLYGAARDRRVDNLGWEASGQQRCLDLACEVAVKAEPSFLLDVLDVMRSKPVTVDEQQQLVELATLAVTKGGDQGVGALLWEAKARSCDEISAFLEILGPEAARGALPFQATRTADAAVALVHEVDARCSYDARLVGDSVELMLHADSVNDAQLLADLALSSRRSARLRVAAFWLLEFDPRARSSLADRTRARVQRFCQSDYPTDLSRAMCPATWKRDARGRYVDDTARWITHRTGWYP